MSAYGMKVFVSGFAPGTSTGLFMNEKLLANSEGLIDGSALPPNKVFFGTSFTSAFFGSLVLTPNKSSGFVSVFVPNKLPPASFFGANIPPAGVAVSDLAPNKDPVAEPV